MQKVIQLHAENWPDLTAPEEPRFRMKRSTEIFLIIRVVLDLVHKTHALQEVNKKSDKKPGDNMILAQYVNCAAANSRR